ncbi:MAG: DMT family transporter, partial [Oscillospiraceae bacterium]|nr:DMT family transporter [Oscillospiraceae bacterium]
LAGVGWGLCSSFTYAVLSLLNRAFGRQGGYSSAAICFYEQAFAALLLLPALWLVPARPTGRELALVAVLGVVCTALAHTLFVASLKKVRVQTAGLVSGMESVYGILLAALLLGQAPTLRESLGCAIVLGATVWATKGAGERQEK